MIIEQQLKDDCTPEIIKKMVELAEGFEVDTDGVFYNGIILPNGTEVDFDIQNDDLLFPLLIHRAVEGWNSRNELTIRIYEDVVTLQKRDNPFFDNYFSFKNYQPQLLTHAECALLHCMFDIFQEISKK